METKYRTASASLNQALSSDEGEIHSDSDCDSDAPVMSSKRPRSLEPSDFSMRAECTQRTNQSVISKRSKNANVWGSVLVEQSSADIASSFGSVGMQYHISRGPESFDLPKVTEETNSNGSEEDMKPSNVAKDVKRKDAGNHRKRKNAKKNNNVPNYKPGQSVTLKKRIQICDDDPVDRVSEEIAFRLWERKRDLIRALTEVLGVPKTIDFYNKTENIERDGGLMIMNGKRRRTPGGTFLYLVRNDPNVDQDPINKVFALEAEKDKLLWELRKPSKSNHCDVMETKQSSVTTPEDNTVEMSLPDEKCVVDATEKVPVSEKKFSDGEIEDSDENTDTFG